MIRNVLIIATSGLLVVNYEGKGTSVFDDEHDSELVSSLISAVKAFANSFKGQEISAIKLTSLNLVILPSMINNLIFVIITDGDDEAKCQRILEDVRDAVIEEYKEDMKGDKVTCIASDLSCEIKSVIERALLKRT